MPLRVRQERLLKMFHSLLSLLPRWLAGGRTVTALTECIARLGLRMIVVAVECRRTSAVGAQRGRGRWLRWARPSKR